jgi:hypothetical protein
MRPADFEKQMRALEVFHSLRLLQNAWVILRLDGRGFSLFTETRFEKPFDPQTKVDLELPIGQGYTELIEQIMHSPKSSHEGGDD